MRSKLPLGVLALAMLLPGGVSAQGHRWDLGVNAGGAYWTKLLDGDEAGVGGEAVKFKPGWLLGSQATFFLTDRIGVRANGAWSYREVQQDGNLLAGDINLFHLTGDLLFRLRDPGAGFNPFVAVGAGPTWVRPMDNTHVGVDIPNSKYWDGSWLRTAGGGEYFIGQLTVLSGLASIGADFGNSRVGLRAEIGDRFFHPHLHRVDSVTVHPGPEKDFLHVSPNGEEKVGGLVHELFAQVGLHLRFGVPPRQQQPVAVAPAEPTPTPTPPAQPQPQPPAEQAVSVCVVDPSAAGGVRTISAMYRPATRDTVVSGVSYRSSLPTVTVASNATWFTSGAPARVTSGNRRLEWVAYGSPRSVSGEMMVLGTLDNVPVYAAASDVASIRARFNANTPLATSLGNDRALWTSLENVRSLYVPTDVVGCRFQELQVRQPSTKG